MKKTIGGKTYNTETATRIGSYESPFYPSDFHWYEEDMYVTKKGNFFLCGRGNAMSPWSERCADGSGPGRGIKPMSKPEALEWLELRTDDNDIIDKYFEIEEA